MRLKKMLSVLAATTIAASSFAAMAVTASAADTTYTWDFTDSTWFSSSINAGSDIISDQNETTALLTNPGAKFSCNTSSVKDGDGNSVQVAKTEATVANAFKLDVPSGTSAVLSIQLTTGSNGKELSIKAENASEPVFAVSDYTKNVLGDAYTVNLACDTTYYLDTSAYKAYIGKMELTVKSDGGSTPATAEVTATPDTASYFSISGDGYDGTAVGGIVNVTVTGAATAVSASYGDANYTLGNGTVYDPGSEITVGIVIADVTETAQIGNVAFAPVD